MESGQVNGSIPQMNRGGESPGIKRLFFSQRAIALILEKTFKSGYGVIKAGTICSVCDITKKAVPYATADADKNDTNAKVYLTQALTDADKDLFVPVEGSYKFEIGQTLILDGSGSGTKEVQSITEATIASGDVYELTFGDITIAASAMDASPTTAELVAALIAATGYATLPFVITAGTNAITLTWKLAGAISADATMEKTTGSGTPATSTSTPGVDVDGDATAAENLGAITNIDRTITGGSQAKISFTTGVATAANFTAALFGCIYVKSEGEASTPFSKAKYLCDQDIDTGTGEYAKGGLGSVVLSNATVYSASLIGMDAAAITDMGVVVDGRFTILK